MHTFIFQAEKNDLAIRRIDSAEDRAQKNRFKKSMNRLEKIDFAKIGSILPIATPDAIDLRLINYTMNDLIDQNNAQMKINMQLNGRIAHLTETTKKIVENLHSNNIIFNEIEAIMTIINIDSINHLLDNIQDAITLSKSSLVSNKILSLRELNTLRTFIQDQGVEMDFPDKALQFVIPKVALKDNILIYMLNVPQLENKTSDIMRI